MKLLRTVFILGACLIGFNTASANYDLSDSALDQEKMKITSYNIMVHSSFSDYDHITAYDSYGNYKWNIKFPTKILSWKISSEDGYLYVFAMSRYSETTKLYKFDPTDGYKSWERP